MKLRALWALVLVGWLAVPAGRVGAQWVEANGLYYGPDYEQRVGFTDSTDLFAAVEGGVFRSTDYGETWTHTLYDNNGLECTGVFDSILLIENTKGDIYRSSNHGIGWTLVTQLHYIYAFLYFDNKLFAGGDGGIWMSEDWGETWVLHTLNGFQSASVKGMVSSGTNLFVVSSEGVWRSKDTGRSWLKACPPVAYHLDTTIWVHDPYRNMDTPKHIDTILQIDTIGASSLTPMIALGNSLFFHNYNEVLRSSDSGFSWESIPNIPNSSSFAYSGPFLIDSKIFVASNDGLFYSADTGRSWHIVNDTLRIAPSIFKIDSLLFTSSPAGIIRSSDGGHSWAPLRTGVGPANSILFDHDTIYAQGQGIYTSTDSGNTWNRLSDAPITLFAKEFSILFGTEAYADDSLYFSTDRGTNWNATLPPVPAYYMNSFCSVGPMLFAGTWHNNILGSSDSGKSWDLAANVFDSTIYSFVSLGGNIVGGGYQVIYRSSDEGRSWGPITNGLPDSLGAIYSPVVTDGRKIVVGFWTHAGGRGLVISADSGLNWKFVNCNQWPSWTAPDAIALVDSDIFVGLYDGGIDLSTDDGMTWSVHNEGFQYGSDESIVDLSPYDGELYARSIDGLIFRRPISEMLPAPSAVYPPIGASNDISSSPNPFTQSAKISFSLREAGYAQVSIVNALGAEVARLYYGTLGAGEHEFTWNPDAAVPGNYWCIVRTSEGAQRIGMLKE